MKVRVALLSIGSRKQDGVPIDMWKRFKNLTSPKLGAALFALILAVVASLPLPAQTNAPTGSAALAPAKQPGEVPLLAPESSAPPDDMLSDQARVEDDPADHSDRTDRIVRLSPIEKMFDRAVQVRDEPLIQFGYSFFERSTEGNQMVRDVGPDYVLGPGDVLQLFMYGSTVDGRELADIYLLQVDSAGTISFAPTGPIAATGRTVGQIQDMIRAQLERRNRQIGISLTLKNLRTFPVYVAGFVESPGTVGATALDTVFQVLARRGGIKKTGSLRSISVTRRSGERIEIDLYELLLEGRDVDLHLQEGDSILVPPIGPVAAVHGQVRRPGIYELNGMQTVEQLLDKGGGTLASAFLSDSSITQFNEEERLLIDGSLTRQAFRSRRLDDGDILRVGRLRDEKRNRVVATGAFKFPGHYSLERFGTMRDLLREANTLPGTNRDYGRVYRTEAGGEWAGFTFSPRRVLSGEEMVSLKAEDEVRLYRRDWIPPESDQDRFSDTVVITGEALNPKVYAWYPGLTLQAILHDGFYRASTNRTYAEVFGTARDGEETVRMFSPEQVIFQRQDLDLHPRDVVRLVPRSIHAPIRVSGEAVQRGLVVPYFEGITLIDLIALVELNYDATEVRADITGTEVFGRATPPREDDRHERTTTTDSGGRTIPLEDDRHERTTAARTSRRTVYLADELGEERVGRVVLQPGDEVRLQRLGDNERQSSVLVRGEVQKAGSIRFRRREPLRLSDAIEQAGGYTEFAYPRAIMLIRRSVAVSVEAQIERQMAVLESSIAQLETVSGGNDPEMINIQLQAAAQRAQLANLRASYSDVLGRISLEIPDTLEQLRGSSSDVVLEAGDQIIVPSEPDFVSVLGEVTNSITINYTEGMRVRDLLNQAGWAMQNADMPAAYIVKASGRIVSATNRPRFLFFNRTVLNDRLEPGDLVYIPREPQRVPVSIPIIRDVTQIIGNLLSTSISAVTLLVTVGAI